MNENSFIYQNGILVNVSEGNDSLVLTEPAYGFDFLEIQKLNSKGNKKSILEIQKEMNSLAEKESVCLGGKNYIPKIVEGILRNKVSIKDKSKNKMFSSIVEKTKYFLAAQKRTIGSAMLGIFLLNAGINQIRAEDYSLAYKKWNDYANTRIESPFSEYQVKLYSDYVEPCFKNDTDIKDMKSEKQLMAGIVMQEIIRQNELSSEEKYTLLNDIQEKYKVTIDGEIVNKTNNPKRIRENAKTEKELSKNLISLFSKRCEKKLYSYNKNIDKCKDHEVYGAAIDSMADFSKEDKEIINAHLKDMGTIDVDSMIKNIKQCVKDERRNINKTVNNIHDYWNESYSR